MNQEKNTQLWDPYVLDWPEPVEVRADLEAVIVPEEDKVRLAIKEPLLTEYMYPDF